MPLDRNNVRGAFRDAFKRRNRKVDVVGALKSLGDFGTQLTQEKFKREAESREASRQAERFGRKSEFQISERLAGQAHQTREREAGEQGKLAQSQADLKQLQELYGERVKAGSEAYNDAIETDDPASYKKAIQELSGIPKDALEALGGPKVDAVRADFKDSQRRAGDAQTKAADAEKATEGKTVNSLIGKFREAQASDDLDIAGKLYFELTSKYGGHDDVQAFVKELASTEVGGGGGEVLSPSQQLNVMDRGTAGFPSQVPTTEGARVLREADSLGIDTPGQTPGFFGNLFDKIFGGGSDIDLPPGQLEEFEREGFGILTKPTNVTLEAYRKLKSDPNLDIDNPVDVRKALDDAEELFSGGGKKKASALSRILENETPVDIEGTTRGLWEQGVRPEDLTKDPAGWRAWFIETVGRDVFEEVFESMTGVPYATP